MSRIRRSGRRPWPCSSPWPDSRTAEGSRARRARRKQPFRDSTTTSAYGPSCAMRAASGTRSPGGNLLFATSTIVAEAMTPRHQAVRAGQGELAATHRQVLHQDARLLAPVEARPESLVSIGGIPSIPDRVPAIGTANSTPAGRYRLSRSPGICWASRASRCPPWPVRA